jgi:hypothetical protein
MKMTSVLIKGFYNVKRETDNAFELTLHGDDNSEGWMNLYKGTDFSKGFHGVINTHMKGVDGGFEVGGVLLTIVPSTCTPFFTYIEQDTHDDTVYRLTIEDPTAYLKTYNKSFELEIYSKYNRKPDISVPPLSEAPKLDMGTEVTSKFTAGDKFVVTGMSITQDVNNTYKMSVDLEEKNAHQERVRFHP